MQTNECSICFDDVDASESRRRYACEHVFHDTCASRWNGNCPNCRAPKKIHNLLNKYPRSSGLDVTPYLKYPKVRACHDNMHALYAFQTSVPPYGCCVTCRSCNVSNFLPMIFR